MINLFDNLIRESLGVNDTVLKYTTILLKEIKNNINKEYFYTDLIYSIDLKIKNLKVNLIKKSGDYAKITLSNNLKNDMLSNCEIDIHINDLDSVESNINHELTHALSFYKNLLNGVKIHKSWELQKRLDKHKKLGNSYFVWKDLIYLIYLTLKHETNSHVSEIYSNLYKVKDLDFSLKNNNKNYKDCNFYINNFNIDSFYNAFINHKNNYTNEDFIQLTKDLCENFHFDIPKDINDCKHIISDIIEKSKKKLKKYKLKLEKVVKRIKEERNKNEKIYTIHEMKHIINYNNYTKS